MIELKNSKIQYLGQVSGWDRYMLDAFIGAVQMREPGGKWQDIRPCLIRDANGWHVEGAPYYAEIKDDGSRLFCPDRNERGKYFKLPAPALFNNLARNVVSNPAKLDGALTPSQITLPTDWGEYRIIFSNTGMHFEILFTKSPPAAVFGKDSPRILLDVETTGIDIEQLLRSRVGIGIPRPRLIADNLEALSNKSQERWLDWIYNNGQLELGFDFTDLPFPILLKNTTVDLQVGASSDDCIGFDHPDHSTFSLTSINQSFGFQICGGMRFLNVTVPNGATIDTSYLTFRANTSLGASIDSLYIYGNDVDNAATFSDKDDFNARALTDAKVQWSPADWTEGNDYNSAEIKTVIQEIVNRAGWASGNALAIITHHEGSSTHWRKAHSYNGSANYAPKIHIEYTAGGVTSKMATETGAGADAHSLLVDIVEGDTAGGSEGIKGRGVALKDDGGGADVLMTLIAGVLAGEAGSGIEQSTLTSFVAKLSAEAGSGIDTAGLLAMLVSGEIGTGVDTGVIPGQKNLFDNDGGIGGDTLKTLIETSAAGSDMKLPGHQSHVRIPSKGVSL
jgi:hypothetical protein